MGLSGSRQTCWFHRLVPKFLKRHQKIGIKVDSVDDGAPTPANHIVKTLTKAASTTAHTILPPPRILKRTVSYDDPEIKSQYEAFHFGPQEQTLVRRNSHPNQIKWLEEYEKKKSPSPSLGYAQGSSMDRSPTSSLSRQPSFSPPTSPVMTYPMIPPGKLL